MISFSLASLAPPSTITIASLLVATNAAHSWINQNDFKELVKKLDFFVVQDMYFNTETADAIYDWLVRWKQPVTIGRDAAGRYTLSLTQTTIVMRPEQTLTFIGPPYDNK